LILPKAKSNVQMRKYASVKMCRTGILILSLGWPGTDLMVLV